MNTIKSVSLKEEHTRLINENVDNLSKYIQNCIERDFADEQFIEKKIQEKQKEIEELKKQKQLALKEPEFTQAEQNLIQEAKEIIERKGWDYAFAQYKRFKNETGRKIKFDKFKEFLW